MIAVVADDFTGAAELGGIGLRYHLRVEVTTKVPPQTNAELLVIATDTRSAKQAEAERIMAGITHELSLLQPELMYKKIDSALRGHILPEITAQLQALGRLRALVVPANPGLGRTLVNGTYFLYDQPIHLSSFSRDPEFAIATSEVLAILGTHERMPVVLRKSQESMPERGIVIAEVRDAGDLKAWAGRMDKDTLLAGASGFFSALLDACHLPASATQQQADAVVPPVLYVCGSTFEKSRSLIKNERNQGGPVRYMPEELMSAEAATEAQYAPWTQEVVSCLRRYGKAIMAIDPEAADGAPLNPLRLREKMARGVEQVFRSVPVRELRVEGGSTASAVLQRLGLQRFHPVQELAPGVIRMQAAGKQGLYLTLKPGSYDWPAGVW